jgi:hypothetical protein
MRRTGENIVNNHQAFEFVTNLCAGFSATCIMLGVAVFMWGDERQKVVWGVGLCLGIIALLSIVDWALSSFWSN